MTELLRQAIAQIEKLPAERQDAIAAWFLAQLQDEQNSFVIDTSDRWTEQDRSDITDFSLQYADSIFK
jgi:uncharacterized protein YfaT (DUF1175 family)